MNITPARITKTIAAMDTPKITGVLGPLALPFEDDRFQLTDEVGDVVFAIDSEPGEGNQN
jgi:hypothetical protein